MHSRTSTYTFGITGGIGSGKSLVSDMLRQKGITILDADTIAKTLMATSADIRRKLISTFGDEIYHEDGELNRAKLAGIIFRDRKAQVTVNRIVHPHVARAIFDQMSRTGDAVAGVEAALIFEAGMEAELDAVIVVDAPVEKRIEWLELRGMTADESRRRMALQMPPEEMRRKATYLLLNEGSMDDLASKVETLFLWLSRARHQD